MFQKSEMYYVAENHMKAGPPFSPSLLLSIFLASLRLLTFLEVILLDR